MQSLNSLPNASQEQINAMQREADKRMKADGFIPEPDQVKSVSTIEAEASQDIPSETQVSAPSQEQSIFPNTIAAPEELIAEQTPQSVISEPPAAQEAQPRDVSLQSNIRALREKAEKAERERDEALRYVKEMHHKQPATQQAAQEISEPDITINDEDLVEGKHLNKVYKELQALRQESKLRQQQSNELAIEAKLKTQYPDFDKIVSVDNLKDLQFAYPELAQSIHSDPNMYTKAVSAYTAIKKLGISQQDALAADKDRALKNAAKPRPLASVSPQQGESPLTKANAFAQGLTEDLKSQLQREMNAARRNM